MRAAIQNGYSKGGKIGGVRFYPLTLDRLDAIAKVHEEKPAPLDMTRAALVIYSRPAPSELPWWRRLIYRQKDDEPSPIEEGRRKFGAFPIKAIKEFERMFEGDMDAIGASSVKPESNAIDIEDETPGK